MSREPVPVSSLMAILDRLKYMNPEDKSVLRFAYLTPLKDYRADMPVSGPINEVEFFYDFKAMGWMMKTDAEYQVATFFGSEELKKRIAELEFLLNDCRETRKKSHEAPF